MDYGYSKTDCYGRGEASSIIVFVFVCWINSWGLACTDSQLNKYHARLFDLKDILLDKI